MQNFPLRHAISALTAVFLLGGIGGCATQQNQTTAAAAPATNADAHSQKQTYFMVFHENGRIYAMTEPTIYFGLLEHNEVPLTRTRIGGGPGGETVIFGITKGDSKKLNTPTVAEAIFDGKAKDFKNFYAEVVRNGRFHVFGEWKDFQDYLTHKEITFTYTEVGAGPKGETVIYALNNENKKKGPPTALIQQFKAVRAGHK